MTRLLLDAYLSPRTASFLIEIFAFDSVALISLGLAHLDDFQVIELVKRERRVLITFDLDFGKLFHHYERGQVGIIVLRLEHQSVSSANYALERFFSDPGTATIALE